MFLTVVSTPQPGDILEDRRGQDNKMSRRVWEAVEASTREVRMGKTRGRRSKRRSGKQERGKREEEEEEAEKRKNSGSKKSSRGMGDMR